VIVQGPSSAFTRNTTTSPAPHEARAWGAAAPPPQLGFHLELLQRLNHDLPRGTIQIAKILFRVIR
ncbi:hypothetical protein, partial [Microbacterium dauci]